MKTKVVRLVGWFIGVFLLPAFGIYLEVGSKDKSFYLGMEPALELLNRCSNVTFLAFMIAATCILNIEVTKSSNDCRFPNYLLAIEVLSALTGLLCYTIYIIQVLVPDDVRNSSQIYDDLFSLPVKLAFSLLILAFVAELLMFAKISHSTAE